jgi:UDP-N-acetylmuramate dehydrogenase
MDIRKQVSLRPYNTFGMDVQAEFFARCTSADDFREALSFAGKRGINPLTLGGGSNVLFTRDVAGMVMHNELQGIHIMEETADHVYVKAGGGENWHTLVMHCVERNWGGVENLSLIPGSAGAGPMQNIGAYGVELKDVFHQLQALDRQSGELVVFDKASCQFDYRSSIFKTAEKDRFIILNVTLKLNKNPVFQVSYGAIGQELEKAGINELSVRAVSDAVIRIRRSKLPDPAEIGNAGSFFKNPSISDKLFENLKTRFPEIPGYPSTGPGKVKVAAGWLIEKCGWKGFRKGDYGVHKNQALVLVNYGQASGKDIYSLSTEIMHSVKENFGIELEREVNIY